jgi:hypothetical protein
MRMWLVGLNSCFVCKSACVFWLKLADKSAIAWWDFGSDKQALWRVIAPTWSFQICEHSTSLLWNSNWNSWWHRDLHRVKSPIATDSVSLLQVTNIQGQPAFLQKVLSDNFASIANEITTVCNKMSIYRHINICTSNFTKQNTKLNFLHLIHVKIAQPNNANPCFQSTQPTNQPMQLQQLKRNVYKIDSPTIPPVSLALTKIVLCAWDVPHEQPFPPF